jgi:hypothetical protein
MKDEEKHVNIRWRGNWGLLPRKQVKIILEPSSAEKILEEWDKAFVNLDSNKVIHVNSLMRMIRKHFEKTKGIRKRETQL